MERRNFIRNAALGTLAVSSLPVWGAGPFQDQQSSNAAKFKLKYAPDPGMFKESAGSDVIDQIRFISDQGFRAIFDNGLMNKEPALQEKIAGELARRNMDLGPFVLYADFSVKSM